MLRVLMSLLLIPGLGYTSLDSVNRELSRRSPIHQAWWLSNGKYQQAPHLNLMSGEVASAIEQGNGRLIICAPPRHGKSDLLSKNVPAWVLNRWPHKRVILGAYGDTFAATWGRKVRDLIVTNQQKLDVRIKRGVDAAVSEWYTTEDGGMKTAGVMGVILGLGADVLIIDDPCKNAREAYSPIYQERLRDWYDSTASTRLEPGATVIVTMQRWPEADFVSWLLQGRDEGREQWKLISLPAIAEADDPLRRKLGAALWPERYDEQALQRKRLSIENPAYWEAQWQQRPPERSREGLAYHAFSPQHSIRECPFDPKLPVAWALDFNVDPMCSLIAQVEDVWAKGYQDWLHGRTIDEQRHKAIRILDEIFLANSSTQAAAKEFIRRVEKWIAPGMQLQVAIYGDASGHSRKSASPADYKVIEEILRADGRFHFAIRADKSNPAVRDRITVVNNAFLNAAGERRLFLDPKCKELRKDLLFMRWKRDVSGNPTNDLDKSNQQRSHISDALGYLCWSELRMRGRTGFGQERVL